MNNCLNALIIEDTPSDAEMLIFELQNSGFCVNPACIQTGDEMRARLTGGDWDIILSDHCLPQFSALEALQIYKESGLDIPFIVVSGQIGEEIAAEFMRGGCHDYVSKNNLSRLGPAIRREVEELRVRRGQEQIKRQLLHEKELFSVTLRSIGDGVIITDIQGRVIFINQAAEELCGLTLNEACGRPLSGVFNIYNIYDRSRSRTADAACESVLKDRQVSGLSRGTVLIDVKGNEKAVSASLAPINDEDHQTVGVVVVFRDISRSIQAEAALARSRDHYLSLFEEFPAMIWQSDIAGKCNYVNKAWIEYTGRGCGLSFNFIWCEGVHPDFVEPVQVGFLQAFEKRQPFEIEYLMMRKDGQYRWIRNVARPFIDVDGKFSGYIGSCYDITDIKNVLSEMLKAKETAEAANSMKNQFLANVSHEIRTPLNGIMGMTELTLATELTPEQRDNLGMIGECAESLMMIIGDILDFSRMEAGKIILENLDFNLLELMDRTVKRFHQTASQKRLNLAVDIAPDVPVHVRGDGLRLQQVLVNLIGNALKFTEAGEVKVEVKKAESLAREVTLEFAVADTGIGIKEEDRSKLFKSFSQVDGSYTRKHGGIGLGLTISAQLVEMMGGVIKVDSQPGQGSRFYFQASFGASDIVDEPETEHQRHFGCYFAPARIQRILVVEDNRVSRRVATRMLRRWGHQVFEAENGQDALQLLAEQPVDQILMDVQMPVMDGIETLRRIRQSGNAGIMHLPVIALTAHALKGDKERFERLGMDAYLSKPFSESELFATIEQLSGTVSFPASAPVDYSSQLWQGSLKGIVDWEELLARVGGDYAFAVRILEDFINDGRQRLANILFALQNNKFSEAEKEAHSLKGAAAYVGAASIKKLAFKIEIACRNEDGCRVQPLYQQLVDIIGAMGNPAPQPDKHMKGDANHEDSNSRG